MAAKNAGLSEILRSEFWNYVEQIFCNSWMPATSNTIILTQYKCFLWCIPCTSSYWSRDKFMNIVLTHTVCFFISTHFYKPICKSTVGQNLKVCIQYVFIFSLLCLSCLSVQLTLIWVEICGVHMSVHHHFLPALKLHIIPFVYFDFTGFPWGDCFVYFQRKT